MENIVSESIGIWWNRPSSYFCSVMFIAVNNLYIILFIYNPDIFSRKYRRFVCWTTQSKTIWCLKWMIYGPIDEKLMQHTCYRKPVLLLALLLTSKFSMTFPLGFLKTFWFRVINESFRFLSFDWFIGKNQLIDLQNKFYSTWVIFRQGYVLPFYIFNTQNFQVFQD